jgi:hypothetical protein
LTFQLLEEAGFKFADFAAAQAGDVDVIARAVGFVIVLIAAEMQQIEFVDQAMALQEIERAIDGDAMDMGIDALGALKDFVGGEMALGAVHHLEKDAALAREADAFFDQRFFQAAGTRIDVNAFSGTDAMCGARGHGGSLPYFGWKRKSPHAKPVSGLDVARRTGLMERRRSGAPGSAKYF